jgi:hypothetical protein
VPLLCRRAPPSTLPRCTAGYDCGNIRLWVMAREDLRRRYRVKVTMLPGAFCEPAVFLAHV